MTTQTNKSNSALSGIDALFLDLEDSGNLMTIASAWLFDEPPEEHLIRKEVAALTERFPRFKHRLSDSSAASSNTTCHWVESENYSLDDHLKFSDLQGGDDGVLAKQIGEEMSKPFDKSKPLWKILVMTGRQNGGAALVTLLHHCITDGQGAVRMVLSLTSTGDSMDISKLQHAKHHKEDAGMTAKAKKVLFAPFMAALFLLRLLYDTVLMLIKGTQLTFFFKKSLHGTLSERKVVAWTRNIPLDDVKFVKNQLKATVNDVLVATVTIALRKYFIRNKLPMDKNLLCAIPISMRAASDWSLGNKAVTVNLWLPVNLDEPRRVLSEVKRRMQGMKSSTEPLINYASLRLFGVIAKRVLAPFLKFYMNKVHLLLTNVPGPRETLYFANKPLKSYIPFIPQPGAGLGMGILSYGPEVRVSVLTDEGMLVNGPEELTKLVEEEFEALKELANSVPSSKKSD